MTDPNTPAGREPDGSVPQPPPSQPSYGSAPPPPSAYPPPPAADPYGAPQAPPSGYAQDAGSYPPPPQGFPAAPAAAGYGAPGGYQQPADIGGAFSWGWTKFTQNWLAVVLAQLIWGVILVVLALVLFLIIGASSGGFDPSDGGVGAVNQLGYGLTFVLLFVVILVGYLSQVAMINGYLGIADGRRVTLGDFFVFRNIGAALLVGVIVSVASALLYITIIGPLVVSFFTLFALYFVVDRNQDAITALKSSVDLVIKNAGQAILLVIVTYLLSWIGAAICGVGALVTVPLSALLTVYLYRRWSGGQIAA